MLHLTITVPKNDQAIRSQIVAALGVYYISDHFDTNFVEVPGSDIIVECKDKGVGPVRLKQWTDAARVAGKRALCENAWQYERGVESK